LALDAIDYTKKDDFKVVYDDKKNSINTMVDCPYFKTNIIDLDKDFSQDITERDSFTIYMCVSGSATIVNDFGSTSIEKGETVLIAASSNVLKVTTNQAKLLEVTI